MLGKQQIAGVGVRKKAIMGPIAVNVYAVGLSRPAQQTLDQSTLALSRAPPSNHPPSRPAWQHPPTLPIKFFYRANLNNP